MASFCKSPTTCVRFSLNMLPKVRGPKSSLERKIFELWIFENQNSLSQWTLKKSLNYIFPTKYVIPKSLKFSHWPSKKTLFWEMLWIFTFRSSTLFQNKNPSKPTNQRNGSHQSPFTAPEVAKSELPWFLTALHVEAYCEDHVGPRAVGVHGMFGHHSPWKSPVDESHQDQDGQQMVALFGLFHFESSGLKSCTLQAFFGGL